jgi:hypothetical protein
MYVYIDCKETRRKGEKAEKRRKMEARALSAHVYINNNLSAGAAVTLIFWEEKHSFPVTGTLITYV